jgi:cell division septation protein DedD
MDWIRRNWPDLLIGIALVAVIAGIIATLLTGGSFFPLGQSGGSGTRPQPSTSASSSSNPSTASSRVALAGAAEAGTASAAQNGATQARQAVAPAGSSQTTAPAVAEQRGVEVIALPLPGATAGQAPRTATGTPASSAITSSATSSAAPSANSAGSTASTSAPAADDGGLYRISVGAFSSSDNAARQATTFREAGYPVFIGTQGNLSIVLVGPYDDQAEAERVADRIRAGNFRIEPVIYRFRAEADSQAGSTSPAPAASQSRSSSTSSQSPAAPALQATSSTAAGARYLQVGAYATVESSRPQRERLEGLGFRVTERTESNLVKLLVGPFAGEDLTAARSRLNEQGIEHFPR